MDEGAIHGVMENGRLGDDPVGDMADQTFAFALRTVTEAAARAAAAWIGRGEKGEGGRAAAAAMRRALERLPIDGVVVIGDCAKGNADALCCGERIGDPARPPAFDIAVDPVEGISFLSKGMTNAMAVIATAPVGAMFDPGPTFYMEKFCAEPRAKGRVDVTAPVEERLRQLSDALGKPVEELTVFVLEKTRHKDLVERIHAAGARAALYPAGDIAGALLAAVPNSGIDALMGTGGTPEGIISACAARALGAEFKGRLDPQLPTERIAVRAAGLDTARWYDAAELVNSDRAYFCATGITTGLLFEGVERTRAHERTQSLMIGPGGQHQILTTYHRRDDAAMVAA